MQEFPEYRFVLETLRQSFPGKGWVSLTEIAKYDGCSLPTARKRYGITGKGLDISVLAYRKCEEAH